MKIFFILLFSFLSFFSFADEASEKQKVLASFCKKVNVKFKAFGWGKIICNPERWTYDELSVNGEPLIYQSFMNAGEGKPTTLVICSIHGDEYTSAYMCVRLVRDMLFDSKEKYKDINVIVAPFINPDGFLMKKPSRLNANGVDPNRNLPTKDWESQALQSWAKTYRKDPRRFPGKKAASEPETLFQMKLIERFKPSVIMAVHSPYTFLDYDISAEKQVSLGEEVKAVAKTMSKMSKNFRVVDFHVFPGSLGNYAGMERGIPTFTLELAKSGSQFGESSWEQFKQSLLYLMQYHFKALKQ